MSMTQVTSGELVDSKIATIGYDQGIKFERASPGMFPHYRQGRWLYEEYGPRPALEFSVGLQTRKKLLMARVCLNPMRHIAPD